MFAKMFAVDESSLMLFTIMIHKSRKFLCIACFVIAAVFPLTFSYLKSLRGDKYTLSRVLCPKFTNLKLNTVGIDFKTSNSTSSEHRNDDVNHVGLIDLLDEDFDIEFAGEESTLDISIAKAVRQMLDDGPKEPELTPSEKFFDLYRVCC